MVKAYQFGKCSQLFHKWLPFMIGLGCCMAGISIVWFLTLGANPDAAAQNAAIGVGAVGNTILGAATVGRWIMRPDSDNHDRLAIWLTLTFLILLAATLCAAFNVDGAASGLGIGGLTFAIVSGLLANAAFKWGESEQGKGTGYHVTYKHVKTWNPWGIFYPEKTGLNGADKRAFAGPTKVIFSDAEEPLLVQTDGASGGWEAERYAAKQDARRKELEKTAKSNRRIVYNSEDSTSASARAKVQTKVERRMSLIANNRRLFSLSTSMCDINRILSTLCVTLASFLAWYLFFKGKGESSQDKPRRRTTIIKKRPTFVKGKRRASHMPTLSALRSEGNLLAN